MKRFKLVIGSLVVIMLSGGITFSKADMNVMAYSDNWYDNAGDWFYKEGGGVAKNAWVHDAGHWYLLGEDGKMRTGLFRSNGGKVYILDEVRGTGTYGKLLKNGDIYRGVTLVADTSPDYEGALSQETINALSGKVNMGNVPDVSNTRHIRSDSSNSSGGGAETADNQKSTGTASGNYVTGANGYSTGQDVYRLWVDLNPPAQTKDGTIRILDLVKYWNGYPKVRGSLPPSDIRQLVDDARGKLHFSSPETDKIITRGGHEYIVPMEFWSLTDNEDYLYLLGIEYTSAIGQNYPRDSAMIYVFDLFTYSKGELPYEYFDGIIEDWNKSSSGVEIY